MLIDVISVREIATTTWVGTAKSRWVRVVLQVNAEQIPSAGSITAQSAELG